MRAGLVGIFFFAAVLALGHYFAAPMFCRGALALSTLDPVQLCTDGALNRQGSMLLYFFAVAAGMFFGILSALIPSRRKSEAKAPEKPETFEEIIAAQEKSAAPAAAPAAAPVVAAAAAAAALSAEASAVSVPAAVPAQATTPARSDEPQPEPIEAQKNESPAEAAVADVVLAAARDEPGAAKDAPVSVEASPAGSKQADEKPAEEKTAEEGIADTPAGPSIAAMPPVKEAEAVAVAEEPEPAAQAASLDDVRAAFESFERDIAALVEPSKVEPDKAEAQTPAPEKVEPAKADEKAPELAPVVPAATAAEAPEPAVVPAAAEAQAEYEPETLATAEAISAGLSSNQGGARKPFEGTVEELVERFRQLRLVDGTHSVAQAQRLLDESTLGALAKGVDPKQHLSDVAHLVLAEDPDLKSSVVRGVVVHIASRLKELGVAQRAPARSVQ